jgi:hypothetical protein
MLLVPLLGFIIFFVGHVVAIETIIGKAGVSWREYNNDPLAKQKFRSYLAQTCPSLPEFIIIFFTYTITVPMIPFAWLLIKSLRSGKRPT